MPAPPGQSPATRLTERAATAHRRASRFAVASLACAITATVLQLVIEFASLSTTAASVLDHTVTGTMLAALALVVLTAAQREIRSHATRHLADTGTGEGLER